jgi:Phosphotransferase enzyme family
VLGRPVAASRRSTGGYTSGWRGVVTLDDGRTAFVKSAGGASAAPVRREAGIIRWLEQSGHSQLGPHLLDFLDDDPVMLAVEDLSGADWPPPWPADTNPLFDTLAALAEVAAPADLEPLVGWDDGAGQRWERVAADPVAFLGLGVCSAEWLEQHVAALVAAERRVDLHGGSLVHNDVYSGNVCFVAERAVLIDWATAARGNPDLDVAFAIVSILSEGGRLPARQLLADEGAWAARLAGHNAVEASSPLPAWAEPDSTLRQDQLVDLRAALAWAARALELPPPVQ